MGSDGGKWLIAIAAIYGLWFVIDSATKYGDLFAWLVVISAAVFNQQKIVSEFNSVAAAVR